MNKWIKESEELVKGDFYLDRLMEIYPPEEISRGLIVEEKSPNLKALFETKNCNELIKELVRLKEQGFKFPIDHPYISFFDYYKEAIDKNPETIKRICAELLKMDYNELKERLEAPKKASRRMGPMFRHWLKKNFTFWDFTEFEKNKTLAFLEGGDKKLKEYAEKHLKCKFGDLTKGLDFVATYKNKYMIGTGKFITTSGGSQGNQFYEAIRLLKKTKCPGNVVKVAVIDGVAWLDNTMKNILETFKRNEFALSALLLKKFLSEIF